jgi:hypothetical protein
MWRGYHTTVQVFNNRITAVETEAAAVLKASLAAGGCLVRSLLHGGSFGKVAQGLLYFFYYLFTSRKVMTASQILWVIVS